MPTQPLGPYKLLTVNSAPSRAKRLVARVCDDVKERYLIEHVGNAEDPSRATVAALVRERAPDLLFTASMWTPSQSDEAIAAAKQINPAIKTLALPQGLQVENGPDAVVSWVEERLGGLIEGET